jgi:type I restriction enzyme S subunit
MIFYKETNLKETSIGEIPRDWDIVKLGDASETIKGKKPTRLLDEKSENAIPYLTAEYMRSNSNVQWCERDDQNVIQVNKNDLLMIWDGSYSGDVFIGFEGALASTMIKITPNENLDRNFLHYFLTTKFDFIRGTTSGTGVPHVSKSIFENLLVPLPPLNEQRAIVGVLGVVDSVIAKTGEVIAKTERLKKGLMQTLLTRGIGHKEYKQTPIGTIPKEWHVTKLGEIIIKLKRGPSKQTNDSGVGVVYLTSDYITDDGFLIFENLKFLEENLIDDVDKYLLEPNDVLVNCVNSVDKIGKVAVFEGYSKRTIVGFNNFALTLASHVNPFFLKYVLLQDRYKAIFRSIGKAAVQQVSFSSKDLLRVEVPIPQSMSEQEEIVAVLSTIDKKLRIEKNEKIKFERIKRSLMDLLLTGKIRVKVD